MVKTNKNKMNIYRDSCKLGQGCSVEVDALSQELWLVKLFARYIRAFGREAHVKNP